MRHLNIEVAGRVQGVSYRYNTQEKALQLGIVGFVKNLPNGSVYIEAEGTDEQLNQLVQWCHEGPPMALVTEVAVSEAPIASFSSFEIRY